MSRSPVKHRCALLLLACCLALPGAGGCKKADVPLPEKQKTGARPGKTMVIGLIPEQNIFRQMDRYEPLARHLSQKTGIRIELTVLPRYGNIVQNFVAASMDGAFFGGFTYCLAHRRAGAEVLVRPEGPDGQSTYRGMIVVRKDSGIGSAAELRGKRFAFVDKATTAGYLLPLVYFREHQIDFRTFFHETYFAGTHEDVLYDVLNRKADAGAAKSTVYSRLAAADPRFSRELAVLAVSPDFPENGLAVRKGLDGDLKEAIVHALLTMSADAEGKAVLQAFGASRFIKTTDADYHAVYDYVRSAGIDLATYDYLND
jgi:phosphonate transport system substrate-binding protein